MAQILYFVRQLLQENIDKLHVRFIEIMSDSESERWFQQDNLPCILIAPVGERTEHGPMANTLTRVFKLRFRLWFMSVKQNYVRLGNLGNPDAIEPQQDIFDTSYEIQKILSTNKQINGQVVGLYPDFDADDYDLIGKGGTVYGIGRDVLMSYFTIENWASDVNPQLDIARVPIDTSSAGFNAPSERYIPFN